MSSQPQILSWLSISLNRPNPKNKSWRPKSTGTISTPITLKPFSLTSFLKVFVYLNFSQTKTYLWSLSWSKASQTCWSDWDFAWWNIRLSRAWPRQGLRSQWQETGKNCDKVRKVRTDGQTILYIPNKSQEFTQHEDMVVFRRHMLIF